MLAPAQTALPAPKTHSPETPSPEAASDGGAAGRRGDSPSTKRRISPPAAGGRTLPGVKVGSATGTPGSNISSPSPSPAHRRPGHIHLEPHILARAAWLPPPDTALLNAYYDAGLTIHQLADMLGLPPRTAARRLRILAERISSPRFLAVAHAAHPDPQLRELFGPPDPDLWPPTRRRVAEAIYIRGLNMRTAARELRLTLHTVRRHTDAINALLNAAAAANNGPSK